MVEENCQSERLEAIIYSYFLSFNLEKVNLLLDPKVDFQSSSSLLTVFGKHYDDLASQEGALLEEMVAKGYDLLGTFNCAHHLTLLKWLDLQGVRRHCSRLVQKVEVFVGKIIQEHREMHAGGGVVVDEIAGDFVDVLLGLERHYRNRVVCRVPGAHGKAHIAHGKSFAVCNTRQRAHGTLRPVKCSWHTA